jgi:hypothetical protein
MARKFFWIKVVRPWNEQPGVPRMSIEIIQLLISLLGVVIAIVSIPLLYFQNVARVTLYRPGTHPT